MLLYFKNLQTEDPVLDQLYKNDIINLTDCQQCNVVNVFKRLITSRSSWDTDFGDIAVPIVLRSINRNCITYDSRGIPSGLLIFNYIWPEIHLMHQLGVHLNSTVLVSAQYLTYLLLIVFEVMCSFFHLTWCFFCRPWCRWEEGAGKYSEKFWEGIHS